MAFTHHSIWISDLCKLLDVPICFKNTRQVRGPDQDADSIAQWLVSQMKITGRKAGEETEEMKTQEPVQPRNIQKEQYQKQGPENESQNQECYNDGTLANWQRRENTHKTNQGRAKLWKRRKEKLETMENKS